MRESTGDHRQAARPTRHRLRWIGGSLAVLALVTAAGAWIGRRAIATEWVNRELASRQVAARYEITELGLRTQRLERVVIGDPARPDLTADWVELDTNVSLSGAQVTGIRAGRVRVRGRLADGRLMLGALDRLLPASTGQVARLSAYRLELADGRLSLVTPAGMVEARLAGRGRIDNGFAGTLAVGSETLTGGGCRATGVSGALRLRTQDGRALLTGPVQAAGVTCDAGAVANVSADVDAQLGATFDRWAGRVRIGFGALRSGVARAAGGSGIVDFAGNATRTAGEVTLNASQIAATEASAKRLMLIGRYHAGLGGSGFAGRVSATGAALSPARLRTIAVAGSTGSGTPFAPLVSAAARAGLAAARDFGGTAQLDVMPAASGFRAVIGQIALASTSGARATLAGAEAITIDGAGLRLNTALSLGGSGLPGARVQLSQARIGGAIRVRGRISPYAAGTARLDISNFQAVVDRSSGRVQAAVRFSGPVDGGRIDGMRAAVSARWDGRGVAINPGCTLIAFDRVRVAALTLDPARARVCAEGTALARVDGERLSGTARVADVALSGTLGGSPVRLAADGLRYRLGSNGFTITTPRAALGEGEAVTVVEAASLDGTISGAGAGGRFTGASGHIGTVPLRMSEAAGAWQFAEGALSLSGALQVADAAIDTRFNPLVSRDMALTLADGQITATATLHAPGHDPAIVRAAIAHDLASGVGHADLSVPDTLFSDSFQPNRLTPLTYGVVAEVRGAVSGTGRIDWTADGATSSGVFRTTGLDLDAAFGPVEGIATEIQFTDLLNMVTAPGQRVTVARVNPGVAVERGVIEYQLLPDQHVRIEGGRWPFAQGALLLDPSDLDLAVSAERRLTFRLEGVDAGEFLQQLDFKNLDATGVFDGTLPIIFNAKGGRIENGELRVRAGGGTIAYVGEVSQEDLGFWGNTAFQALKSLRYKSLTVAMNGALDGDMITEVRFTGLSQGKGAKSNFLVRRLQRLPFEFNVRITA
ncbi:MAG: hypothetical protein C0476_02360, partial [Sphingomonas sp.]|nr:hypothetical protein [Sphingomonas sp.]